MIALLGQWRVIVWIGLGALVVVALGWASLERVERRDLTAQLAASQSQIEQAAKANASLAASLEQLRAEQARLTALQAAEASRGAARARQAQIIREGIRHAPAQDDGPVAPVLNGALDRLRRTGAASAGGESAGAGDAAPVASAVSGKP